jgi:hypothetical protein
MSHLSIERLAALVDDQPTADERVHLAACEVCARELRAHSALFAMAASERESIGVPLTDWDTLASRLKTEGLVSRPGATRRVLNVGLRAAAILILIGSGAVIGRASTGSALIPGGLTGSDPQIGATSPDAVPTTFASVEDARRWQRFYATAYQRAVTYVATNDTVASPETPAVMRTRLSALDQVSRVMREALNVAPDDPVINDFYLHSFDQREATVRQLNAVLPQGVRLKSF